MAALDRSIFRERAIERYAQRQEIHVLLRLVSPRIFFLLWVLFVLFLGAAALAWSIQEPVTIAGSALIIQQKVNTKQQTVVLLLLPADQQASLHTGQPVTVSISATAISFTSSIQTVETAVMSPDAIRSQFNVPASLASAITGPFAVAVAPVEPASSATTYLGSQCQVQVQIGSESVLSLLPGFSALPGQLKTFLDTGRSLLPAPLNPGTFFSRITNLFKQ